MTPIEAYIRQAAQAHGIDPDVAVRVASSEGGLIDPFRQADGMLSYGREQSYGPFQLHMKMGGLGTRALAAGIDPRKDWQGGVDYALNEAAQKGWGQWFGAAKAGIGNRMGIGGAHTAPVANPLSPQAQDFVLNNPQPGGFGPGVPDPNSALFGSMSPGGGNGGSGGYNGMTAQNNSIDPNVANYAFSEDPKGGRLSKLGAGLDAAMSELKPPRIAPMPSPSGDVANGLTKLLQNPQALAQLMMKQRFG